MGAHIGDVKESLEESLAIVGEGLDLSVMGPAAELEKLKDALMPLGAKFWEIDSGSLWRGGCLSGPDSHVTIVPYFTVPDDKMDLFKSGFEKFYSGTKAGTEECLYYGFAVRGNQVFCREGYKSAAGALAYIGDVKESLEESLAIVGEGLDLSVMGPAAELEKLKDALMPLGAKFWEIDSGSLWK